ncbi:MAG: NAD+ synthase [candidate division Zixibacteria bacterium]|nr:NAD+ synthase [candidate division Zixibacteria bacterium]
MARKALPGLNIDVEKIKKLLIAFIKEQLKRTGFTKLVMGISGGVDSAVVAYLAAEAIERDNITGVIMPYASSDKQNIKDAELVLNILTINRRVVDISPMVDAYFKNHPTDDLNRRGNKMSRERMSVLYDISAEIGALVIGTSNKSEIKVGYGTLFGDLACAINPLGDLYKTQVRQLARHLNIPEQIIAKPPSADLWQGQTDEGELGLTYKELDTFLYYMDDQGHNDHQLEKLGFSAEFVKTMKIKIAKNEFKGRPPKIALLPR